MRMRKFLSLCLALCLTAVLLIGCQPAQPTDSTGENLVEVDYVSELKLNMDSSTAKIVLKNEKYTLTDSAGNTKDAWTAIYNFVDGDTVHFNVPTSEISGGILKARFLAIDTPESTGKIEAWGKTASEFTETKLKSAVSIVLESDSSKWELDSTGGRYLTWVWYKTAEDADYRNLNVEILQNGLAAGSKTGNNIYGDTALSALYQAQKLKLHVYSGKNDPNFYYGSAVELDLKGLRQNIASYNSTKVAFTGVVTCNNNNGVYVESYDEETEMYYGIYVYYGFSLTGEALEILNVGNEVRIVGSVSEYNGSWQVSGLTYRAMKPNDPGNIQKIGEGTAAYAEIDPKRFANETMEIEIEGEDGEPIKQTVSYASMLTGTTVEMKNLVVVDSYTTSKEDSSSKGAFTLNCTVDGANVDVRTIVLYDEAGNLVKADAYMGKTISVKGIVDYYDGKYQIKVFSDKDITIQ